MGALAKQFRALHPGAYDDLDDATIEAKLQSNPVAMAKFQDAMKPKVGAMESFGAGVVDAYNSDALPAQALRGVVDAISLPVEGLGMLADVLQTGGSNIRLGDRGGLAGAATGGAALEKSLPAQAVDTLRRRIAYSAADPIDPSLPFLEQMKQGAGRAIAMSTGVGINALGTGEIPGSEEHIRESFKETNVPLAVAEGVASPIAELGSAMVLDPAMGGLMAAGNVASRGAQAAKTLAQSGAKLTPKTVAHLQQAVQTGKVAGTAGRAVGASFVPGMTMHAGESLGEGVHELEEGNLADAAEKLTGAVTSGAFATMAGRHATQKAPVQKAQAELKPAATSGAGDPALTGMRVQTLGAPRGGTVVKRGVGGMAADAVAEMAGGAVGAAAARAAGIPAFIGRAPGAHMLKALVDRIRTVGQPDPRQTIQEGAPRELVGVPEMEIDRALAGGDMKALSEASPAMAELQRTQQPGMTATGDFGTRPLNEFELNDATKFVDEAIAGQQEAARAAAVPKTPVEALKEAKSNLANRKAIEEMEHLNRVTEMADKYGKKISEVESLLKNATYEQANQIFAAEAAAKAPKVPQPSAAPRRSMLTDEQAAAEIAARDPFQNAENIPAGEVGARLPAEAPPRNRFDMTPEEQQMLIDMIGKQEPPAGGAPPPEGTPVPAGPSGPPPAPAPAGAAVPMPDRQMAPEGAKPRARKDDAISDTEKLNHPVFEQVMAEFEAGTLKSSNGKVIPAGNDAQARAIARSMAAKAIRLERERAAATEATTAEAGPQAEAAWAQIDAIVERLKGNVGAIRAYAVKMGVEPQMVEALLPEALKRYKAKAAPEPPLDPLDDVEGRYATERKSGAPDLLAQMRTAAEQKLGVAPEAPAPVDPINAAKQTAGVLAVTPGMKRDLLKAGYTEEQIGRMSPEEAANMLDLLGGEEVAGAKVEVVGEERGALTNNDSAGAGSGGSAEALSRTAALKAKGQKHVILDRAGNPRPATEDGGINLRKGETFGLLSEDGSFQVIDSNGGPQVPKKVQKAPPAAQKAAGTTQKKTEPTAAPKGQGEAPAASEAAPSPEKSIGDLLGEGKVEEASARAKATADKPDGYARVDGKVYKVGEVLPDGRMVIDDGTLARPRRSGTSESPKGPRGKQYSAYKDVKRPEPLIWANRDIPGERFKDVIQYRIYGPNKNGEYTVSYSGGVGGSGVKPIGNFKAKSAAEARELATQHYRDNYKSDGYVARRYDGKGGMEVDPQYSVEDQFANQGVKGPKSADRELLRLRTAGDKKDVGPPEPKGKLTPPDPDTVRPFADDYLSIEDVKRGQPISKGERYSAENVDVDYVEGSAWKPPTLEEVRTMLPKGLAEKTFKMEDGSFEIDTPRGRIRIEPTPEIKVDLEALEKGRPGAAAEYQRGELSVSGEKTTFGGKAIVRAVTAGVLPHEVGGHVWFDHFASKAQRDFLVKKFEALAKKANQDVRETIADAYSEYHKRKLAEPGWEPTSATGKFVKNIYDFMTSVYHSFRPTVESTFEQVRTGKDFERAPNERADTGLVPGFRPQLAENAPPVYGDKVTRDTRPYRTTAKQPQLVAGGSAGKNVPVSQSGEPSFTLKATPKEPLRILMPDGSVKKLPIRGAARLMGVPDSYPLPSNEALARTILGNGVPPPLMKKVAESLLAGIESPKGVSLFSGGGIAEQGLKGRVEFIGAVEFNKAIADHYRKANGDHVVNDDVRNVDFTQWQGADYLHASPVCKNFSGAKAQSGEVPLDIETAKATARAIDEIGPKVVTVENVPGYMGSEAMKIITEQLTDLGYKWDARVYDAADYGVPQTRKRMILRAVKDGELPSAPPTEAKVGWWDSVKDLQMEDDKSGLAAWQKDRMHKQGNIQLEKEKYSTEGPKPLRAAVGSMLKSAENVKNARPGEKGLLETQKTDLKPRLAKKSVADEPIFDAKAPGVVQRDGVVLTKGAAAPAQYSARTTKQTMETVRRLNEEKKVFTKEQLDKYEKDINSIAAKVMSDPERLDFVPIKGMTSLKANGDSRYPKSLDFTTACKRRYALAHTIDAIQERTGKLLEAEDVIKIRKSLEDMGVEVNCGPCYVDSRRINMATAINKAIQGYEMKKGDKKGSIVKLTPENAKLAMTQEGRDKMFENDPEQYAILSQAFAGTQIKIPVGRAEYKGEIAELPQSTVDAMNKYSGMRSQSWSDFEVPHLLDKMQAVMEQALRKLKGQSYTKEIDYVETMKDTGEMINMSLIPDGTGLDANGKPLWKETESVRDMKRARQIRKQYDNVGFEGIGISDEHIKALLADPEVDYVIPYHSSGLRREFQDIGKMRNWKDYTKEQSWRDAKTGEKVGLDREIFISEWQGDLKKLDKLAKERGVIPPFERFRNTPGYEKLLTDRRIWGNNGKYVEQQPMQFKFDMKHVNKLLDGYKGGADKNQAVPDVVAEFLSGKEEALQKKVGGGVSRLDSFDTPEAWWNHHKSLGFSDAELREAMKQQKPEDLKKLVSIGDIDVATRPGSAPAKVEAYESGVEGLAITKILGKNPGVNLTHTASGMSFGVAVPKSAEKAIKQFAKDVYDLIGDDIKTPDFHKRLTDDQKRKLNQLAKDLTREHGIAASRRDFFGRVQPKTSSIMKKMEQARKEVVEMQPKTGEQLRELAKKDPVGYAIEQAVNYGFDNMHRVAAETDIGKQFGQGTPLGETYQGGYVAGPHKAGGWAGARKPLWAGSLTHHGQLMVSRAGNLYDAAATAIKQPGQSIKARAEAFVDILQRAEKGDQAAIDQLKPHFKAQILSTIAHELLHGFRGTSDKLDSMQRKMNESAQQLLDAKTKAGTTLREELDQYFEAKSMDKAWSEEIQRRATDVLKMHDTRGRTGALMLKKPSEKPADMLSQMRESASKTVLSKDPEAFKSAVKSLKYGKQLPDSQYVHNDGLSGPLRSLVDGLRKEHGLGDEFNLIKLGRNAHTISFLEYPDFATDPHPALATSVAIDLSTGKVTTTDFSDRANRPILHRKESFVPSDHPDAAKFKALSDAEDAAGLLGGKEGGSGFIGYQKQWDELLKKKGLTIEGHSLGKKSKWTEEEVVKNAGRTSIKRGASSHAKAIAGEIRGKSVIDWGQGKYADDVKFFTENGAKSVRGYDPNFQPELPTSQADVVTNTFVGNVLTPGIRRRMWTDAMEYAKEKLLVAVRAENPAKMGGEPIFDGVLMGVVPKDGGLGTRTFQKFYNRKALIAELQDIFPEHEVIAGPVNSSSATSAIVVRKKAPKEETMHARARGLLYGFRAGERRREYVAELPSEPTPKEAKAPGQLSLNDVAVGQQVKTDDGRTGVIIRVPAGYASTLKVMVKFGKSLDDLTEMSIKDLRYVK